MTSQIGIFFALLLVAGCYSAPHQFGAGFRIGAESQSGVTLGGNGSIKHDGGLFSAGGKGLASAKWKGGVYGGGYANVDDKYIAGRGALNSKLGGGVELGANGKFGSDKDGNFPIGLQGSADTFKQVEFGANGEVATGKDGKNLSQLFKNSGFDNPQMNFN